MNKIQQQKVALVAGASGIIGSQLVKTLLRNGWEVIGLSRHALSTLTAFRWSRLIYSMPRTARGRYGPLAISPIFFTAHG